MSSSWRSFCSLLLLVISNSLCNGDTPEWWNTTAYGNTQKIITEGWYSEDLQHAVAQVGHGRHVAIQFYAVLDAHLPGDGLSFTLAELLSCMDGMDDKEILRVGTLKVLSKPFYEELAAISPQWLVEELGFNGITATAAFPYPWANDVDDEDFQYPATVAQVKCVFSLNVGRDKDEDHMNDLEEYYWFGWLYENPKGDKDGDGTPNDQEIAEGRNPIDDSDRLDTYDDGPALGIKFTPTDPLTPRDFNLNGGEDWNNLPSTHLSWHRYGIPSTGLNQPFPQGTFEDAYVVIKNNLQTYQIEIVDTPGAAPFGQGVIPGGWSNVAFRAFRDPADNPNIGTGSLDVVKTGPGTGTVATDQIGSFLLIAFDDVDGDWYPDSNESHRCLPIVVVGVDLHLYEITHRNTINVEMKRGIWRVATADYSEDRYSDDFWPIIFEAKLDLVGGGGDGTRGLDYVFPGWLNNVMSSDDIGLYKNGGFNGVKIRNRHQASIPNLGKSAPALFKPTQQGIPIPISGPMADSETDASGGGSTYYFETWGGIDKTPLNLGERWTMRSGDGPQSIYPNLHPFRAVADENNTANFLKEIYYYSLDMRTSLCCYTTKSNSPKKGSGAGYNTFHTVMTAPWSVSASYSIDDGVANKNYSTFVAGDDMVEEYSPPKEAKEAGIETRGPGPSSTHGLVFH